jgi:ATP-binding cassette subfamily C (CFTR/MRP) protein 4
MIREQLKDTTMLTIAHRLATIATSDQIMVINNGSIAEMESPHVLK